jgi:serine/threonine protein kinase
MPLSAASGADRNLLFGILAVNLNFITRDQLIVAMNTWVLDKRKPLDAILVEQGSLTPQRQALLQALVEEHLRQHDNDPQQSLAAVSSVESIRKELAQLADPDVAASLKHVTVPQTPADPAATVSVGAPTAAGLRFRILRPHAKGGLGQVYVAEDQELHREVALKEIQDKHAGDSDSRTRFLIEAEITGALEHPGIVPVYGLGQYADGRPFYAMRLIRGDSLKEAIERFHQAEGLDRDPGARSLELRKLLGRFIDVCEAIQYAHDRGILHRDLKPGNIMLGKYGETLVVDWGLAKPLERPDSPSAEPLLKPPSASGTAETVAGSAVGTPQYMSPEQAEGRLDLLGPASDVYSLGATLYCLLTGRSAVEDSKADRPAQRDLGKLLGKVARGQFPRPRALSPRIDRPLEAICLKAMALHPGDRYRAPRELANDLEHWLAGEPVSAWPEPWYVKARRWVGKHRPFVTGAAAALVVGVISLTASTVLLADANDAIRRANQDLTDANTTILEKNQEIKAEATEKERQRKIAVDNEKLAVAAHKKAEQRLDQSVETLKLFANDVRTYCDDAIVPGASKQKLFEVLLGQLEALAAADPDKEFNEDKIRARVFLYETVALTQMELGQNGKAGPILAKALKLTDEWLAARPGDPGALGRRAAVLHLLGESNRRLLNEPVAVKYLTEAYEIRKLLLGNAQVERFTPAKTMMDLGDSLDALERWEEAIQLREQALAAVRKHIQDHNAKEDDAYFALDGLNWTYQKAARGTADYTRRKAYLEKADATSQALAKLRPTGRVALKRWAENLSEHGAMELRLGDLAAAAQRQAKAEEHFAAAGKLFEQRAKVLKQLATSEDLLGQRRDLAGALYDLARVAKKLGQTKQADGYFQSCLNMREEILRDYPTHYASTDFRVDRLLVLAQLGRHEEVTTAADQMRIKFLGPKTLTYNLACLYALSIPAVEAVCRPAALTDADKALQKEYRQKALDCLEDAVKQGFDRWDELRTDPDLAPVRDEPRFQKILEYEKK